MSNDELEQLIVEDKVTACSAFYAEGIRVHDKGERLRMSPSKES